MGGSVSFSLAAIPGNSGARLLASNKDPYYKDTISYWEEEPMVEIRVCASDELSDGDTRIQQVGGIELAILREQGELFAYRNLCPHQGGPACEGVRMPRVIEVIAADGAYRGKRFADDEMQIICPWHGYAFDLKTGVNPIDGRLRLAKFEAFERDGEIYVVA